MNQQTIELPGLEARSNNTRKPGPCGRCGRRHRPRPPGAPGPHDRERTLRPRMGPCRECGQPSRAKDLCSLHYSRMRRAKDRGRCTIPECGESLRYQGKLYCEEHAICMVPGCPLVNKARRLCRRHYQSLYLTPRNRREREKRNNPQGKFHLDGNDWTVPVPEGQDPGARFRMGPTAPPLHQQASCTPKDVEIYQRCADALTLLQAQRILPPGTVSKGRDRTVRMMSKRLELSDEREAPKGGQGLNQVRGTK